MLFRSSNPVTEYCLENTQEKEYNNHAYTTQVLLQANFAPKKLTKIKAAGMAEETTEQEPFSDVKYLSDNIYAECEG